MNKVFFEKLKETIEAGIQEGDEFIVGEVKPLVVEPEVNMSGNVTQEVTFDGAGNAGFSLSKRCFRITIHISGSLSDGPDCAVYNLTITTDFPQRFEWVGLRQGQVVTADVKTNLVSKTNINASLHSTVPNSKVTVNLNWST